MRIDKPWGYEIIWAHTDKYVGKILHINSGHSLSRQLHRIKEETLYVSAGSLLLEIGSAEEMIVHRLSPGDAFHVPPGLIHRMRAPEGEVELVEVSTPELDDVVRLEDFYGRS